MRGIAILPLCLLTMFPALAQDGPAILSPDQIGQIYCFGRLGNDASPIEALLTPDLGAAIADARAQNEAWAEANPGEKPPLGDGIPWQAWPDHAGRCMVQSTSYEMDEARVWLRYTYPETPRAEFVDTLHLKLIAGPDGWNVWRIDNVSYETGGDLRSVLTMAFMEN